jgi:hypothetical protein
MLTELRKIIFPDHDLADAITTHDRLTDGRLPAGSVYSLSVTETPEPCALLTVRKTGANELQSVYFDQHFLIAAMLRYCIEQKVIIPKRAKKWIEVAERQMVLVLRIDDNTFKAPESYYYVIL